MWYRKNLQCLHVHSIKYSAQAYYKQRSDSTSLSRIFDGIGCFPGPPYHIQVDHSVKPKQCPCWPVPVYLKEPFNQEIDEMLHAGILKPVYEATPQINSFVLVEGKDKLGKLKLRIYLDPTNLNKAILCGPYHFQTPEDIVCLFAEACIITVCDCRKAFGINSLMKLLPSWQHSTLN